MKQKKTLIFELMDHNKGWFTQGTSYHHDQNAINDEMNNDSLKKIFLLWMENQQ
jgi:hypothetical protein